jgi:predicted P-loop ATPase
MQIEMKVALAFVWEIRSKLWAEGSKLRAEGDKLWAEGSKLRAEGYKLWAEGSKLWAEGDKLRAEGDELWAEAVLAFAGNIKVEWIFRLDKNASACKLESGEIFEP